MLRPCGRGEPLATRTGVEAMLSTVDNELLTRTGPGTAMGELFRRFWVPAFALGRASGPERPTSVAFGLLGEQLVAFRESSGTVGVLEARCPHRHASLFWGRNEEGGSDAPITAGSLQRVGTCAISRSRTRRTRRYKDSVRALAYEVHE